MTHSIARFFAIAPGEENKTILLYLLHFFFFLGQSWGALAALTLFLDNWPAEDLAFMFIGSAIFMLVVGLAYASFADRVSDLRLLITIYAFIAIWLFSVRLLLLTNGGQYGLAYPYYYLLYDLVRDLSVLHMITYTNGFYNTRSAKRTMPLVLSAGLAANTVAGFTVALIGVWIGLENIPILWMITLIISGVLVVVLERTYGRRGATAETAGSNQTRSETNSWQNLKEGFSYVRDSSMLRWLSAAAFGMVLLMNVLTLQSSEIFQVYYEGNREGMLAFFGIFAGFSNLVGLLIQSVLIGRLISAVGVGTSSLIFPSITMSAILLISLLPTYLTAVYARLTFITFRRAIQVPIDAILYNCLHPSVKGRARAFIHTMVIPLGALTGGLLLLTARQGFLTATQVSIGAVLIAALYFMAMWRVRREYGLAFSQLLADGELAFLRSGEDAFQHPDPNAINALLKQLDTSESLETTLFLAEMLLELQGPAAFATLRQVADEQGPAVQAELIRILGDEWITHPTVHAMAVTGLQSEEADVVIAAASALAATPKSVDNTEITERFLPLLEVDDVHVRATVLPTLLHSSDPTVVAAAQAVLSDWLGEEATGMERQLAMRVQAQTGDDAVLERLEPFANDPAPGVRIEVIRLLGDLIERTDDEEIRSTALILLSSFLQDEEESIELAAIRQLGSHDHINSATALWPVLGDPNDRPRRAAANVFPMAMEKELEKAVSSDDFLLAESATFVLLSTFGHSRYHTDVLACIEHRIEHMNTLHRHIQAIQAFRSPAGRLFQSAHQDAVESNITQIFWLLGSLGTDDESQVIRRSLQSLNEQSAANGAEALESLTSPQISRALIPFLTSDNTVDVGNAKMAPPKAQETICMAWPELTLCQANVAVPPMVADFYDDEWLKAIAIHTIVAEYWQEQSNPIQTLNNQTISDDELNQSLVATDPASAAVLIETLAWARSQVERQENRRSGDTMLTMIEKVLFLKDVSLFEDLRIDQLRVLAAISEEIEFASDQHIVNQGEYGDSLYVIVHGKAAVQSATTSRSRTSVKRLAVLGPSEYFGEMTVFDSEPFGSDVVTIDPTVLLQVRQESMMKLITLQPELSLSLLRVFSLRLRHFMRIAEEKTTSKPKELMDLYDSFEF